jgi:hypothetical protein
VLDAALWSVGAGKCVSSIGGRPFDDSPVVDLGGIMDVLYSIEDEVSKPDIHRDETIRYGDPLVLASCVSGEAAFLSIVRHRAGKRSPSLLRTDLAASGRYPNTDYIWTFVPAAGTKRKHGDAVLFADRVRIRLFDYTGNYRYLAVDAVDPRLVTAEKAPSSPSVSTWSVACAARLRTESDGRVLPDGNLKHNVEFGKGNYIALINTTRYLSVSPDHFGGFHNGVSTLPDLPATGVAVWWRIYRSLSDACPSSY